MMQWDRLTLGRNGKLNGFTERHDVNVIPNAGCV